MWTKLIQLIQQRQERARQQRQLRDMDLRMLTDLALSRVDVERLSGDYVTPDNQDDWRGRTWKR